MRCKYILLALFFTLISTAAFSQSIEIQNLTDGDVLDFENIQFNVRVEDIPNDSVQSRIEINIWQGSNYLAHVWNYCQAGDGTYRYDSFRVEFLNLNNLGDFWCLKKDRVTAVARMIDVSEFPPGTPLRIIAKFEWADDGWQEITESIYVYAE